MKKTIFTISFVLLASLAFAQEPQKTISGTVSNDFGPLKDVNVVIEGSDTGTSTDADGKYEIQAEEGDILVFSRIGMLPTEIIVEDVTRVLNVTMFERVEQLEEVTVTEKKNEMRNQERLAIEYDTNTNLIKTGFGILDKEKAGYSMRILDEKNINPGIPNMGLLLNSRFPGLRAFCDRNNNLQVTLRSQLSLGGTGEGEGDVLFDIDGQLFNSIQCSFVDPSMIKRIAIIPSYSATAIYGGVANGGVVAINTKAANHGPKDENGQTIDLARIQDNKYLNDAIPIQNVSDAPIYLQNLYAAETKDKAIEVYQSFLTKHAGNYFFFLDAHNYFASKWKNQDFADEIIDVNWSVFENNPVALKSLAYIHQANNAFEKANDIYKEVFVLRPNYVQSYRDLANSYVEMGEFKRAAAIFARYGYLMEEEFLTDTKRKFSVLMDRELNNLIKLKGRDLLSRRDLKKLTLDDEFDGTRLVFEWANSEAEFELQFVNPQNRYFRWHHSLRDNAQRIADEKSLGYAMEEYLIDESLKGEWKVNIKYLGNKSLTPTYLKATVYHNYGSASQRKEVKVFKLSLKNVNQQLFTVNNHGGVASK